MAASRLLNETNRCINTGDVKALAREPRGVPSATAANVNRRPRNKEAADDLAQINRCRLRILPLNREIGCVRVVRPRSLSDPS